MRSSLSRIQAIIYDRHFPRFPRPGQLALLESVEEVCVWCAGSFLGKYIMEKIACSARTG